jgi:hypothetical protein
VNIQKLHIAPITADEADDAEYSVLDEEGVEIAVVTGKAWALKFAVSDELLELAIQFAAECLDCNGTGEQVVEHDVFGPQVTPCPDCAPIREVIRRANGAV